jgi:signal transduction histidine kinase
VDIRAKLEARPRRPPNYEQEDRAYGELATEMAENPRNLLQKLAEVAVDLCQAHTAGVSLLDGDVFRWEAVAGVFAAARGGTMPRTESPCGVCIDRDAVQLMHFADRCFPALLAEPRFVEALLIPFHHHGRPIGTVWVVSHNAERNFDKEDERVVRVLSRFASAGWQLWKAYEAADEASRRKDDVLATLDRRVAERTAELTTSNAQLALALAQRTALEEARTEWLTTLMAAQEDERRRVGRELHDEMGQHVSGLRLGLHTLEAEGSGSVDPLVWRLKGLLSDLERGVRRLACDLRPTALDDLGMTAALRHHVDEWSRQTGIAADFCSLHCEARLSTHIETTAYRIVQEALTNIARHAQARNASVILERRQDSVVVIIEDDGHGFDPDHPVHADGRRHFGLVGIRERAALLGGTATIESSATTGTTVFVKLPVPSPPDVEE